MAYLTPSANAGILLLSLLVLVILASLIWRHKGRFTPLHACNVVTATLLLIADVVILKTQTLPGL